MFINKDSVIINGTSMGTYLVNAKFGRNKLWADDTGRNLNGGFTGTLVGIFPKFTLTFRKLNKNDLDTISAILDADTQTVQYYSPRLQQTNTIYTYSGDWEYETKNIGVAESFSCSCIARSKEV